MKKQIATLFVALAAHLLWSPSAVLAQEANPGVLLEDAQSSTNVITDTSIEPAGKPTRSGVNRQAVVNIGKSIELPAGDTAEAVIAIGGSVKILGKVTDAVVAVAGDVEVEGEVSDAVVAVLGNVRLKEGARVGGDVVAVGGRIEKAEGATIGGETQEVDFGMIGIATPEWLREWFIQCVLKLRPMAPQIAWLWAVAGGVFLFYLIVALFLNRPVQACVSELTERPATSLLMGILTKVLIPVVFFILAATGVGLIVVPFLIAAFIIGAIIGKVALVEAIGIALGRQFGFGPLQKPIVGFFVGSLIILLLYMIPVLGLLVFALTGVWGLGAVVLASFGTLRREIPKAPPAQPGSSPNLPQQTLSAGPEDPTFSSTADAGQGTATLVAPPESIVSTVQYPKATFWERMGAAFLDIILVSILGSVVGGPPLAFLVALAYFAGMWGWKGTTIGGIVLGLKVVRLDQQPVTFAVAIVRGLAAAFSVAVLFLGFLWIAWDKDKQGWHDKIAGTVVLKLPRGTPLVCF